MQEFHGNCGNLDIWFLIPLRKIVTRITETHNKFNFFYYLKFQPIYMEFPRLNFDPPFGNSRELIRGSIGIPHALNRGGGGRMNLR